MGVRELALVMLHPQSVSDVVLSLEQEWMFSTHEEEEQTAVREFAADFRLSGREPEASIDEESDVN
jgi:hypothetical protein